MSFHVYKIIKNCSFKFLTFFGKRGHRNGLAFNEWPIDAYLQDEWKLAAYALYTCILMLTWLSA
jgi:hypothetical protein